MSDILIDEQTFPSTPANGSQVIFADSSNSYPCIKNDAGIYIGEGQRSTIAQIASHSANTYYIGIQLPSFSMQAGMLFEWEFPVSKTAAGGIATPIYTIVFGANQSVADTVRLTLTGVLQSSAADTGVVRVRATCRSVGAAGVLRGFAEVRHNLATTGFASGATSPSGYNMVEATSSGFDNTALGGQYIGLCVNPGASGAWVVEQCTVKMVY